MIKSKRPRYMNGSRRELLLWANAISAILTSNEKFLEGKELTWLKSIVISVKAFNKEILRGIDPREVKATLKAANNTRPQLYSKGDKPEPGKEVRPVQLEIIWDLAEQALDLCKYDCDHDFENCPRRALFIKLLIPAWRENGPCQYYRGEGELQ